MHVHTITRPSSSTANSVFAAPYHSVILVTGQTYCYGGFESKLSTLMTTSSGRREYDAYCQNSRGTNDGWSNMFLVLAGESPLQTGFCYNPAYKCPW